MRLSSLPEKACQAKTGLMLKVKVYNKSKVVLTVVIAPRIFMISETKRNGVAGILPSLNPKPREGFW